MKQRLTEIGKNILIVLLSCSLIFLFLFAIPSRSIQESPWLAELLHPLAPLLGLPEAEVVQMEQAEPVLDAAQPIVISLMTPAGRSTAMWDPDALDAAFALYSPYLGQALNECEQFTRATQEQVQEALSGQSVYFRYASPLPADLLAFWLGGSLDAAVGDVDTCILSASQDTVSLYLLGTERYFSQTSISSKELLALLQTAAPDGSLFAFETPYPLAPLSILPGSTPALPAITASNPCDSRYINSLATALGFNPYDEGRYTDDDGNILFSETNASLEISERGRITYRSETPRYFADSPQPEALAETARQLTDLILADVPGEGRLYLTDLTQTGEQTVCRFTYILSGLPLHMPEDAACITFTGTSVTEAVVQLYSFTALGKTVYPLPTAQAAAMLPQGSELEMAYCLNDDRTVIVGWAQ